MSDLKGIEQQMGQLTLLVGKLIEKVDHLDKRFDTLEDRLDKLESRFDKLENRFDKLESRFETEQKLNQARFDELLKEVRNQNYTLNYHREKIARNEEEINM